MNSARRRDSSETNEIFSRCSLMGELEWELRHLEKTDHLIAQAGSRIADLENRQHDLGAHRRELLEILKRILARLEADRVLTRQSIESLIGAERERLQARWAN